MLDSSLLDATLCATVQCPHIITDILVQLPCDLFSVLTIEHIAHAFIKVLFHSFY